MSNDEQDELKHDDISLTKVAGICLAITSFLSVVFVTHHPTSNSHTMPEFVSEVARKSMINSGVHGALIAMILVFLFSFSVFSQRLGWNRPSVRFAFILYSVGILGMTTAAMVSGFIVPQYLARYGSAGASDLEMARHVIALLREVNRATDHLGMITMSGAVIFWSLALIRRTGMPQVSGGLGLLAGIGLIAAQLAGHIDATVPGIISFMVVHVVWNILACILMLRKMI